MSAKKTKKDRSSEEARQRMTHEAEGGASGAVAGAGAGPPGIVAGALVGAVAGAVTGAVLDGESSKQRARTRVLDAEIGVSQGELGAPNLKHPPAIIRAYSGASAGVASPSDDVPAEGPMQPPEE